MLALFCVALEGTAAGGTDAAPGVIHFRGHMALGDSDGEFKRGQITRALIDEEFPERSEVDLSVDLARSVLNPLRVDDRVDIHVEITVPPGVSTW